MSYTREEAQDYLVENLQYGDGDESEKYTFDEVAEACVGFAQYAQEIITVECARCQKTFQSVESVKYCSIGCELGYAPGTWWR